MRQFTLNGYVRQYVDKICVSSCRRIVVENTRIFGRFQSYIGLLFSVVSTGSIFKSFHVSHQEYDHIDDFFAFLLVWRYVESIQPLFKIQSLG